MTELGSNRTARGGLRIQLPKIDAPAPQNSARSMDNDVIQSAASTSRLANATLVPTTKRKHYSIDIGSIQRNIDRLAMAEQTKHDVLTPKDLYRKAHPGLLDYTDPRQWYSSNASKKLMKSFLADYQPTKKGSQSNEPYIGSPGQVAFLVTFPDIRKQKPVGRESTNVEKSAGSGIRVLPNIQQATTKPLSEEALKSNVEIKEFIPQDLEKEGSARSHLRREATLYDKDVTQPPSKPQHDRTTIKSRHTTPDTISRIDVTLQTPYLTTHYTINPNPTEFSISQTSSAIHRKLTSSVEDLLKSVTGGIRSTEPIVRALQQPPSHSIELPTVESNASKTDNKTSQSKPHKQTKIGDSIVIEEVKQTGGMTKATSLFSLNRGTDYEYIQEGRPIAKAESMESLLSPPGVSREKYMQLRLPKQKSEVDELHHFRETYSLRQKSNLNLKTSSGVHSERRKSTSTSMANNKSQAEQTHAKSKLGPYIQGKVPSHYLVVPDSNGEPQAVSLPQKTNERPQRAGKQQQKINIHIDLGREKTHTSMSDNARDESNEVRTLGTISALSNTKLGINKGNVDELGHPQRSARSPQSKRLSLVPSETYSRPANPPPSQLSIHKPNPRMKRGNGKHLAISDSYLYKIGKDKAVVNLSLIRRERTPTRQKTLIRAIDKYINEKLGDKLREQQELAVKIVVQDQALERVSEQNTPAESRSMSRHTGLIDSSTHPLLQRKTRIKVKPGEVKDPDLKGKRAVYRRKKLVTPFQERESAKTREYDEAVIIEEYLNKNKYNPQLRPPSYRLDLRQYPQRQPTLLRDTTFDKRTHSIVEHSLERNLTEFSLRFPSRLETKITEKPTGNDTPETRTSLHVPKSPGISQPRHKRTPGNGGTIEFHIVNRTRDEDQYSQISFQDDHLANMDRDQQRPELDNSPDSIDTSMLTDIYTNLESYLVRMNSRDREGYERLMVEME